MSTVKILIEFGEDEDHDIKITFPNGENVRFDSSSNNPDGVSFVRFYKGDDEITGWTSDEWGEDPQEVMGAILGNLCEAMKGER